MSGVTARGTRGARGTSCGICSVLRDRDAMRLGASWGISCGVSSSAGLLARVGGTNCGITSGVRDLAVDGSGGTSCVEFAKAWE